MKKLLAEGGLAGRHCSAPKFIGIIGQPSRLGVMGFIPRSAMADVALSRLTRYARSPWSWFVLSICFDLLMRALAGSVRSQGPLGCSAPNSIPLAIVCVVGLYFPWGQFLALGAQAFLGIDHALSGRYRSLIPVSLAMVLTIGAPIPIILWLPSLARW